MFTRVAIGAFTRVITLAFEPTEDFMLQKGLVLFSIFLTGAAHAEWTTKSVRFVVRNVTYVSSNNTKEEITAPNSNDDTVIHGGVQGKEIKIIYTGNILIEQEEGVQSRQIVLENLGLDFIGDGFFAGGKLTADSQMTFKNYKGHAIEEILSSEYVGSDSGVSLTVLNYRAFVTKNSAGIKLKNMEKLYGLGLSIEGMKVSIKFDTSAMGVKVILMNSTAKVNSSYIDPRLAMALKL